MTSGAKKRMTKKIYFSHNLEIIKNERGHLMKIKTSYLIYAVIGTVFAGLSMFTDIFEKGNFEAIFSNLGMIIGLSISAYILITMAKSFIDLVIKELKKKLLKILSIMLLAVIWTILFAYVLLHGSSDILYSVMGVSVAACYVFLAFYQKKGNHTHE